MTKQHFIALADWIRDYNDTSFGHQFPFTSDHINALADFLQAQNPLFNRARWLGYLNGTCGPNGGEVK